MLENNNLSYTAQNDSSLTWEHFVYRCQIKVTAEFLFPSMILQLSYIPIKLEGDQLMLSICV